MKLGKVLLCLTLLMMPMRVVALESSDKERVPYEIQNMYLEGSSLIIEGWGMLSGVQHFRNSSTHQYQLQLSSTTGEIFLIDGQIMPNDQTEVMKLLNVRKCGEGEYSQDASICYYDYKNVGFRFVIPLEYLKTNESYQVSLIIHGLSANVSNATKLFYPSRIPVVMDQNGIEYKIVSDLYDTSLKVVYQSVFERPVPANKDSYRYVNKVCSPTYGYAVFYQSGTIFDYVYDRYQSNGTTYYKVYTQNVDECYDGRNVSKEGNEYEAWIAGNFVDYIGEPLRIEVTQKNEPPLITILSNPTIFVGESIEVLDYAVAYDIEDGDLTEFIQVIDGVVGEEVGNYPITFYVEDSLGAYDIKTMVVTVKEPDNTPPNLDAYDQVIYQYEEFDYYAGVSAFDEEDGWLTDVIGYDGYVDTETLGVYYVTYYVADSKGLIDEKTISVKVIRNPREKIRYIDTELPFYQEPIPRNWQRRVNFLFDQLKHPQKLVEEIVDY